MFSLVRAHFNFDEDSEEYLQITESNSIFNFKCNFVMYCLTLKKNTLFILVYSSSLRYITNVNKKCMLVLWSCN